MSEYKLEKDELGDPIPCSCCDSEVPVQEFDCVSMPRRGEKKYLCEVCAVTEIGTMVEYFSSTPDPQLLRVIAQVGNLLLEKIKK